MPEVMDTSGGIYGLASAAGAAMGRAQGSTYGLGNALSDLTAAAGPAMMQRFKRAQTLKDSQAFVQKAIESGMLDDKDGLLFQGMALGGMDPDRIAVMLDHHLSAKERNAVNAANRNLQERRLKIDERQLGLEEDRAYGYDTPGTMPEGQMGPGAPTHIPGSVEQGAARAESGAAASAARAAQGERTIDLRERSAAETERHNRAMEARPAGGASPDLKRAELAEKYADEDVRDAQKDLDEFQKAMDAKHQGDRGGMTAGERQEEAMLLGILRTQRRKRDEARKARAGELGGRSADGAAAGFDYNAIPSGAEYTDPNGVRRRKR